MPEVKEGDLSKAGHSLAHGNVFLSRQRLGEAIILLLEVTSIFTVKLWSNGAVVSS